MRGKTQMSIKLDDKLTQTGIAGKLFDALTALSWLLQTIGH